MSNKPTPQAHYYIAPSWKMKVTAFSFGAALGMTVMAILAWGV